MTRDELQARLTAMYDKVVVKAKLAKEAEQTSFPLLVVRLTMALTRAEQCNSSLYQKSWVNIRYFPDSSGATRVFIVNLTSGGSGLR